jgi:isopentenyldiphosphate isomerase
VHLWIIRGIGPSLPEILFQERASHKAQYPDCLDITVGGHVPFGVKEGKIQKEAVEEIGICPLESELTYLGLYRYEERNSVLFHREFQRVYLLRRDAGLDTYRFVDGEVTGIYAVPLEYVVRLLGADEPRVIDGYNGKEMVSREVSRSDFHPLLFEPSMREYMATVISATRELFETGAVRSRMPAP